MRKQDALVLFGAVALYYAYRSRNTLAFSSDAYNVAPYVPDTNDFNLPDVYANDADFDTAVTVDENPLVTFFSNPIGAIMGTASTLTRGERNNNPGNIVKSKIAWDGAAPDQSGDTRFVVFQSPEYGIRALGKILLTYQRRGWNTVRQIIMHYAPPSENDTSSYINNVAARLGVSPDDYINLNDANTMRTIMDAIITQENGRNMYASSGVLDTGISMIA